MQCELNIGFDRALSHKKGKYIRRQLAPSKPLKYELIIKSEIARSRFMRAIGEKSNGVAAIVDGIF